MRRKISNHIKDVCDVKLYVHNQHGFTLFINFSAEKQTVYMISSLTFFNHHPISFLTDLL